MSEGASQASSDGTDRPVDPATEERLNRLLAENERLRSRRRPGRGTRHRMLALALAGAGVVALAAGWYLPDTREVLFVLGGTGLFAAILVVFLTPERYVPASVSAGVYTALSANLAAMVGQLGLTDVRVYVPREAPGPGTVSLFVPLRTDFELPPTEALEDPFVVAGEEAARGVSLRPSAGDLLEDFATTESSGFLTGPEPLAEQLADGLVSGYGLVDDVAHEVDADGGRADFAVSGALFGPVDRFDDPVSSFLAGGIALGQWRPVSVAVSAHGGDDYDHVVTCRWSTDEASPAPPLE